MTNFRVFRVGFVMMFSRFGLLSLLPFVAAKVAPLSRDVCPFRYQLDLFAGQTCYDRGTAACAVTGACSSNSSVTFGDGLVFSEDEFRAWTQRPKCTRKSEKHDVYCVFTSAHFANGRGISILTDPATAKEIASLPAFRQPKTVADINDETGAPFEMKALPGRGFGLVATRPLHRGDSIFSHTPVYMINMKTHDALDEEDRLELQREAIKRLPPASRELYMALHGHFGGDPIDDRLNTNSFYVELDHTGVKHNIMLPETSVSWTRRMEGVITENRASADKSRLSTQQPLLVRPAHTDSPCPRDSGYLNWRGALHLM